MMFDLVLEWFRAWFWSGFKLGFGVAGLVSVFAWFLVCFCRGFVVGFGVVVGLILAWLLD